MSTDTTTTSAADKALSITTFEAAQNILDELLDEAADLADDIAAEDADLAKQSLEHMEERLNQLKEFVNNQIKGQ